MPLWSARLVYALISLGVIGLDQWTKSLVLARMPLYASIPLIPGLLHFTLVYNRGALFGIFHDLADPLRSTLFLIIPAIAIVMIVAFQYLTTVADTFAQAGLALILGGAMGNLIDRVRLGYVVDFVDAMVGEHHWPAFNVADSAICVGVSVLVLDLMIRGRRSHGAPPAPPLPEA